MKHYIDAQTGSEEFRQLFREIRNAFIESLHHHVQGKNIQAYRACDTDGNPIRWVWDEALFKNAHLVGTICDAENFMANMIDQGMCFAFSGIHTDVGIDVWLTTWEEPEEGPKWPNGQAPVFEEIHGGVTRRKN